MSVNEKLKDAEAGSYGSIAPEPENDAVAYVKRHTIALGALSVLAFGAAAVALVTGPPPLALASGGYLVGGMLIRNRRRRFRCSFCFQRGQDHDQPRSDARRDDRLQGRRQDGQHRNGLNGRVRHCRQLLVHRFPREG